jgi:hypothetical protein
MEGDKMKDKCIMCGTQRCYPDVCSVFLESKKLKKEKEMKTLNKLEAYMKIIDTKGKIFTAEFVKKDGEFRTMNCRLGVMKDINGKGMSYKPLQRLLLPVFDMQKNEYRMINLNTMYSLKIGGVNYRVQ